MNRSSVRNSPAGRGSYTYLLMDDSLVNGKIMEDGRGNGEATSSPAARSLTLSPSKQDHLSPSKPHFRNGDTGIVYGAAIKADYLASPDSIKPSLSSSFSGLGQSRNKKGYTVSLGTTMVLCFVSAFFVIGMLGSRSSAYKLRLVPTLGIYRSYRRLQAEVAMDPFKGGIFGHGTVRMKELPSCDSFSEDFVPCYSSLPEQGSGFVNTRQRIDRYCESSRKRKQCLVPPPEDYRLPLRWPASKDGVWRGNMKFVDNQGLTGDRLARLNFGADDVSSLDVIVPDLDGFVGHVPRILKAMSVEENVQLEGRTILDINCGLSRMQGGDDILEKSSVLCVAPFEVNGSQVQIALERGYMAMIGSLSRTQLPFPSASLDLIHVLDSDLTRTWNDSIVLLEFDRLLKPNGYFVWAFHPMTPSEIPVRRREQQDWQIKMDRARKICWTPVLEEAPRTLMWRKTANESCYASRSDAKPEICSEFEDAASTDWYPPLRACITRPFTHNSTNLHQFPTHSGATGGLTIEEMGDDTSVWASAVKSYWSLLTPLIFSDHPKRPGEEDPSPPSNIVRNILDMNAGYGSLNSALLDAHKSVWVMNVVPRSGPDTLSAIYKRGLIGLHHDWCEALPTYPRSFDLLHGIGLLSQESGRSDGCGLSNLFLEMDRILRPEGWVILRDKGDLIEDARIAAAQMRWESRVIAIEGHEDQQLLVCQKLFWKNTPAKAV